MMKKASFFLIVFLPLLVACGTASNTPTTQEAPEATPAAQTIALVAKDITYDITTMEGMVGQEMHLNFSNQGALEHDFTIDEIEVHQEEAAHAGHDAGSASESDIHFHLDPGTEQTFTFTPAEAGTYTYYCSVPGHREAGMTGTLTVTEASP